MIRMIQSSSASHAKAYFSAALVQADYYLDDQELQGRFGGKLADRLGLGRPATKDGFFAMCENVHPGTGKPLTPRVKADRITGYDINFHCPKSVSILHALAKDGHIMEAFTASVGETMADIEADAKTRIRKDGAAADRQTGELAWAEFTHQTARPVDGHLPDPHLHSHCFVFNATWDDTESRYKAAKFRDIKRDMPYYQARFQKRLSDRMMDLGYGVRRTATSFEIEGVPLAAIELFSKRTDEIGRVAEERGIQDAKALAALGAATRGKKQKGLSMAELKTAWRGQMAALGAEVNSDQAVRYAPHAPNMKIEPERCVEYAVKHAFERASVMPERRLLEHAYKLAIGQNGAALDAVTRAYENDDSLLRMAQGERAMCTTRAVLAEERRMVALARKGRNAMVPLYQDAPDIGLDGQQAEAVRHVLTTPNRVSIIRGAAGTGKTTLMKEAVRLIEGSGHKVITVAPTAEAARGVLRGEGFAEAETVASLLVDPAKQKALQGQVLWVDEAGLLGTKDMRDLLELATRQDARVILGGDTRQHASVVRGDALRILNTVGGIRAAEVDRIVRQRDAEYRDAVAALSKGRVGDGFARLDGMGAIRSVDPLKPNEALVEDYVRAVKSGKTALVISPTHKQGDAVTHAIRARLKGEKLIGKKEIAAKQLVNANLTEAEKGDWRKYAPGQVVQFSQNARGIRRGSAWTVTETGEKGITLRDGAGDKKRLPLKDARKFDLFDEKSIGVAKGDRIRITRNGFDANEKRLNNGQTLTVASVRKDGRITLQPASGKGRYVIDRNFGHLAHAHCITSYAAQGKTVDEVLIAQPAATFAATDARQFYVSVSRGREKATIYTDDKAQLLEHAAALGERQSALELVEGRPSQTDHVVGQIRSRTPDDPAAPGGRDKPQDQPHPTNPTAIDRDYEPEL